MNENPKTPRPDDPPSLPKRPARRPSPALPEQRPLHPIPLFIRMMAQGSMGGGDDPQNEEAARVARLLLEEWNARQDGQHKPKPQS